jgi:hypothetical protein
MGGFLALSLALALYDLLHQTNLEHAKVVVVLRELCGVRFWRAQLAAVFGGGGARFWRAYALLAGVDRVRR